MRPLLTKGSSDGDDADEEAEGFRGLSCRSLEPCASALMMHDAFMLRGDDVGTTGGFCRYVFTVTADPPKRQQRLWCR